MAAYVELNGVNTWYDERGEGDPLVLLHGGLSDSRDFAGNIASLANQFRVLMPERRGHGHTGDVDGPITIDLMASDTIAFLDKIVGGPVRLVGYSQGAAVALFVALQRPDLVDKLVLISGSFDVNGMLFKPSTDGQVPPPVLNAYAEVSPDGPDHLPVVLAKIARAAEEEAPLRKSDLSGVTCRTLVMAGDDDLVTLEHTLDLYRGLSDSELAIVPGTSHVLLHEKPAVCTQLVAEFLTTEPIPTYMPIRRSLNGIGSD